MPSHSLASMFYPRKLYIFKSFYNYIFNKLLQNNTLVTVAYHRTKVNYQTSPLPKKRVVVSSMLDFTL